ncbi:hypothetical protein ROG8370_02219 [Roseovarius gaetbuli]|uniref:Uncharacterized protein n=1 Tax=Roseovarius gaetbuli TaxID=1356575 RepID=A0A1X6ZFI8_9RHOB|nr:hypothetical protein [Roseovarius gaetbuli]SLN50341.1 hypothetical protein ROG8370_02219 [Roseovarius gaetbuli]
MLETIASLTRLERMSDVEVQHFLPGAADDNESPTMIVAPVAALASNNAVAEFGAALFPVSGAGAQRPRADRGGLRSGPIPSAI